MESDYFPISFQALKAEIRLSDLDSAGKKIGAVGVDWIPLRHPGGCLGYALTVGGAKVVYMTDQELVHPETGPVEDLRSIPAELVDFVRGADLLIGDGQYTDEEYAERVGWGHSSCFSVVDLALRGQVKHLALFHHEPSRSDLEMDDLVDLCRRRVLNQNGSLLVSAAREGVEFRYPSS
jgi:ribonuclease BN (tRNA processing enzyme)